MMKHLAALFFSLFLVYQIGSAQHSVDSNETEHKEHEGLTHKVTLVMANSLIKNQVDENANSILVVPTFGLNYDFLFHPRWGVGVHTDIVLQQYKVEDHGDESTIIRENPVALVAMGLYSPIPSLIIGVGYGVELETHENIQLLRFGVDMSFTFPNTGSWV